MMSRYTKKNIKAIEEINIAEGIIKKHFNTLPVTASKLIQDTEKQVKREVLDILFNGSKERQ